VNQGRYLQLYEQKYIIRIVQYRQRVPDGHLAPADEPGEHPMQSLFHQNNPIISLLNPLDCPVAVSRKRSVIYNVNLANMRQVQYKQLIKIN